jgi:glycosyltransferase involved in cell wall biosynthesis
MRVLLISKAMRVASTQSRATAIGREVDLTLVVPDRWPGYVDEVLPAPEGYERIELPVMGPGRNHLHLYRGLGSVFRQARPDLVHVDEEHYSLVTYQVGLVAHRAGVPFVPYTWQNIQRVYPPPFRWTERWVLHHAAHVLCGNQEAADVLRAKGYRGATTVVPQFGLDPSFLERRLPARARYGLPENAYLVGYAGRLIEAKGVDHLIRVIREVPEAHLVIVGHGPARERLEQLAAPFAERVHWMGPHPSSDLPDLLASIDVLALPSRTTRTWKEQFGRILVEAMAQARPVIASDSGEIPNVVGDAGFIAAEDDLHAWRDALVRLRDPALRDRLGAIGQHRAGSFAQATVAARTVDAYRLAHGG